MASPLSPDSAKGQRVAVVGAGVTGLAAAYKLHLHGLDVTVFEADERAGGKLKTVSQNGLVWDEGANTMTETDAEVSFLLDNLGLRQKQQYPISQNKRYIARNGRPVLLPSNPLALVSSCFLSTKSKLRILLEPLLWKKNVPAPSDEDESVGGFFGRHFGKEMVEYVVDPFVAGTSGADPDSIFCSRFQSLLKFSAAEKNDMDAYSMPYAFPELWNLEKRFGSIVSGAFKSKLSSKKGDDKEVKNSTPNKKHQRGSFSFLGGMQILVDSLCTNLGKDRVELRSKVLELSCGCHADSSLNSWTISYASQNAKPPQEKSFDAVVVTAPLCEVKDLKITKRGNPFLLDFVPEITYLPLSVMITAFKKVNVKQPLEGFGVLIPSKEQQNGLQTLGTLFSSMMFPDRAPSDMYLYTTFIGGSRNKELAKASRDDLKQIVSSDLRQLLGAEGEPTFVSHLYWSKAFPLYGRNYKAVMQAIDKLENDLPGFFYAGNHKGGLSVGKAMSSGCKAADIVILYLDSCTEVKDDSQ